MAATVKDRHAVTAAKAALEGARASFARCPSGENHLLVKQAQDVMNSELDLWAASRTS